MLKLAIFTLAAIICLANATQFWHNKLPGRIVGGEKIKIEDAPYQLALIYVGRLRCGGLFQLILA